MCYYSGLLHTLIPSRYDQKLSIIIQPRALSLRHNVFIFMSYISELAFYDVGLSDWIDCIETSQDSQQVIYEDPVVETRQLVAAERENRKRADTRATGQFTCEETIDLFCHSPPLSPTPSRTSSEPMENITKYSGGGGLVQRAFIRDIKAVT